MNGHISDVVAPAAINLSAFNDSGLQVGEDDVTGLERPRNAAKVKRCKGDIHLFK
jgi:hypothetical protein